MAQIHYALQTCDTSVRDNSYKRYCGHDKPTITKTCVTSFLNSVKYAHDKNTEVTHNVAIIDDHSTPETVEYLKKCVNHYSSERFNIELIPLESSGLFNSVRACYDYLENNGIDIVYQVQDDYLFEINAIYEMVYIFYQIYYDTKNEPIISPFNHPYYFFEYYKYRSTPRVIVPGISQYWIQHFEIPCTFMTSKNQFSSHWDLYENFFNGDPFDSNLEINSFNKILTERNVPAMQPMTSVALHMQSEGDLDPYIDWKSRWDSVKVLGSLQQT